MMKFPLLIFYIAFILTSKFIQAQTKIPTASSIAQIDSLNRLAFDTKKNDIGKAVQYLEEALFLSRKNNYERGLATTYLIEAGIYSQYGFNKIAQTQYLKSLELFRKLNDRLNVAVVNVQIATILGREEKHKESIQLLSQSKKVFEEFNSLQEIVNVNNSLARQYYFLKDYTTAESLLLSTKKLADSIHYAYGYKKSIHNLSEFYYFINQLKKSEDYCKETLEIDIKLNDDYGKGLSYLLLANIELKNSNYDKAIELAKQSYESSLVINAFNNIDSATTMLSNIYAKQKNIQQSHYWLSKRVEFLKIAGNQQKIFNDNFIETIKEQQNANLSFQNKLIEAEQKSQFQKVLSVSAIIVTVIVGFFMLQWRRNFKREQMVGEELKLKNEIIEAHIEEMEHLNADISQKNKLLELENSKKNKLISIISHDLRHPLVNTKGIIEVANAQLISTEELMELLVDLDEQYARSINLLDNLLFWIKGQAQGDVLRYEQLNVEQLFNQLIEENKVLLERKKLSTELYLKATTTLNFDREVLRIVMRNILVNAIKFSQPNDRIVISSSETDEYYVIEIKDFGVGMPPEIIEKVNNKNYYTSVGTKNEKGTGVGLMICLDLIAMAKGELQIESEINKGSTFRILLPLIK